MNEPSVEVLVSLCRQDIFIFFIPVEKDSKPNLVRKKISVKLEPRHHTVVIALFSLWKISLF